MKYKKNSVDNYKIINQKEQAEKDKGVKLAGDGRFDSPGWSAKFCNYFIQVRLHI